MTFILRDYQIKCLEAIREGAEQGIRRQLVVMATGLGKTVVFSHIPEALNIKKRMLILAHREELLDQAAAKLRAINPDLRVEVEQADRRAGDADIVVGSIATLAHKKSKRLEKLDPSEFDVVVVDEAHHAVSASYRRVLEHFGTHDPWNIDAPLLLGVTATPERGDAVGLEAVFDGIAFEYGLKKAVLDGWLVRPRAWRSETGIDLAGVHTRLGDYVTSELAEKVNTPQRNAFAVRSYEARAVGRRALAFTVDVQHAHDLAQAFNEAWIPAAAVWGDMDRDERRETLRRFADGELLVLTNCSVLTEGYDCPEVSALLMCRPTKSCALYLQCLGRGLRPAPDKEDLVVIDLADTTSHALPTVASLLGLPPKWDCEGKDVVKESEQLEMLLENAEAPHVLDRAVSIEDAHRLLHEVDIIGEAIKQVRSELKRVTKLAWLKLPSGGYYLTIPGKRVITLREDQLGHWHAHIADANGYTGDLTSAPHADALPVPSLTSRDAAIEYADLYVRSFLDEAIPAVRTDGRWRNEEATDAQIGLLKRMHRWKDGLTRGEAKDLIDSVINRKAR